MNGEALSPAQIMVKLNELGRKHGIGRVDMVENRFVGIKSRGVYETPGGTIIYVAHKDLEGITMERETMHIRDMMMPSYAGAIYNGFWYSPEREAMQAFIDKSQERVSGTVRLKLYKGNAWPSAANPRIPCTAPTSPPLRNAPPMTTRTPPASSS